MRYHNIAKDDFLNGDGIRAVLFVSGCTHHCPECHNPVTWNKDGGLTFDEEAKKELFDYLAKDYVSGITFSGGDPLAMYNRDEVLALMDEVKEKFPNKTIWVYTGWTREELKEQEFWDKLTERIDVIVEGKFEIDKKKTTYEWAGSTNQRVFRKEDDFLLNTSDEIYKLTEDIKKDFKSSTSINKDDFESIEAVLKDINLINQNEAPKGEMDFCIKRIEYFQNKIPKDTLFGKTLAQKIDKLEKQFFNKEEDLER